MYIILNIDFINRKQGRRPVLKKKFALIRTLLNKISLALEFVDANIYVIEKLRLHTY